MTTEESLCFCIFHYSYVKTKKPKQDFTDFDICCIFNHWHKYFNNVLPKDEVINKIKAIICNAVPEQIV
jgi:hypothetical protein